MITLRGAIPARGQQCHHQPGRRTSLKWRVHFVDVRRSGRVLNEPYGVI